MRYEMTYIRIYTIGNDLYRDFRDMNFPISGYEMLAVLPSPSHSTPVIKDLESLKRCWIGAQPFGFQNRCSIENR